MRMRGVEPPRAEAHRHLKPARLPIPPHPQGLASPPSRGQALQGPTDISINVSGLFVKNFMLMLDT